MFEKKFKIILFFLALMVTSEVQPQTTHPRRAVLPPSQIAKRVLPSIVVIFATDSKGNNSLGSGFFVEPNVIATNYHVVENAAVISARLVMQKRNLKITGIVGFDADKDLALLSVEGIKVRPLRLGKIGKLSIGDEIYVASNPEGWQGTFSEGIVAGFRRNGYIQITAPVSHGSSGGPVVNKWGEVIGIVVSSISEGQNLNFAIRASDLLALQKRVDQSDDIPSLEEFTQTENRRRVLPSDVPAVRPGVPSGLSVDEFLVCRGNKYYKGKRFSEAAEAYREAIRLNPSSTEAYYRLGNS
jgi:S1-C subfamily serine protease